MYLNKSETILKNKYSIKSSNFAATNWRPSELIRSGSIQGFEVRFPGGCTRGYTLP